jgi:putative tryptophan/tyrosine transport system substrate-binding protein
LREILFLITALLLFVGTASASEVLVVQSLRNSMYEDAINGFSSVCPAETRTLVLSDYADAELARVVREERPRLVLVVGDRALAAVRKIRKTPVVAIMALGMRKSEGGPSNLTGVDTFVRPEQYLYLFKKIKARRIGIVYDPARTGWYVKLARVAAKQFGVELVVREVNNPRQAIGQLNSLQGAVDSVWILPDATALTMETLEAYFLFSQGESIPVISFTAAHLKLGALIALEMDRVDMGKQAGEMAQELLDGADTAGLPVASPRKVVIKLNDAVAKRLNYSSDLIQSLFKK